MIGLSILSGSHRELIPDVIAALREAGGGDIPLVVGGIIPDADAAPLRAAGVAAVYTPKDFELDRHPARSWHGAHRRRDERRRRDRGDAGARRDGASRRGAAGAPSARGLAARRPDRRAGGAEPGREPLAGAREDIAALLGAVSPAALGREAPAHVVGVTGPPGAGKSTLLSALVRRAGAQRGRSVAVLAVDPSSKRSGGALLGDRARIEHDPADRGVFIRSMAAGERLGGLAPATRAAAQALAAAFDVVVIETVGVGQSETEVAEAADTVAVVVQPGSGDALQFLKAGIMEVPDVLVVTKADLGVVATARGPRPARGAAARWASATPRCSPSRACTRSSGIDALIDALDAHREGSTSPPTRVRTRRLGALADFVAEHGARGLRDARRPARGGEVPCRAAAGGGRTGAGGGARGARPRLRPRPPRSAAGAGPPARSSPARAGAAGTRRAGSPSPSCGRRWSSSAPRPIPARCRVSAARPGGRRARAAPPAALEVRRPAGGMTSPSPQRWVWTTVRSSSIA